MPYNRNMTVEQIENIVLDAGAVYLNYGGTNERLLAPTRGGNSFVVEQEVKIIERDGALGKEKGMRRVINENAMMTVRLLDLSPDNIKLSLAGARKIGDEVVSIDNSLIPDEDYIDNVTLVAPTMAGDSRVITIFNALGDNGLNIDFTDKDEAVLEVQFSAHRNPLDYTDPIYSIDKVEAY
jgi:hypothetical protein